MHGHGHDILVYLHKKAARQAHGPDAGPVDWTVVPCDGWCVERVRLGWGRSAQLPAWHHWCNRHHLFSHCSDAGPVWSTSVMTPLHNPRLPPSVLHTASPSIHIKARRSTFHPPPTFSALLPSLFPPPPPHLSFTVGTFHPSSSRSETMFSAGHPSIPIRALREPFICLPCLERGLIWGEGLQEEQRGWVWRSAELWVYYAEADFSKNLGEGKVGPFTWVGVRRRDSEVRGAD